MSLRARARSFISLSIILVLSLSSQALADKKDKKDKKVARGTPVLWREPVDIASRNLYWGPGGEAMRPDLRRLTFIKEEKGGWSTKYRVQGGSIRDCRHTAPVGRRVSDGDHIPCASRLHSD